MELGHLLECSSSVRILLYYDLTTLGYVLLWWWWRWIHVATWWRWWVEILLLPLRGVAVYFFPPGGGAIGAPVSFHSAWGCCMCSCFCLSWFFGFLFFCLQGKFGECAHWLHPLVLVPELLAVSEVSPFLVDEALGIYVQQ